MVGSRFLRPEGFRSTALRRAGIGFLSGLTALLGGVRVRDITSGMRAAGREAIALFAREYAQDYPEPESVLSAGMEGLRVMEVPVEMRPRTGGRSSISPVRSVYYMVKVSLALLLRRCFGRKRHAE